MPATAARISERFRAAARCVLLCGALLGCQPTEASCFELTLDCADTAAPDFATLHRDVLRPRCGTGGSCHVDDDVPAGDLRFDDEALAYALLLDPDRRLVDPARPECSEIVRRVTSRARFVQMPPSAPLSAAETCAVIAWVRDGAR